MIIKTAVFAFLFYYVYCNGVAEKETKSGVRVSKKFFLGSDKVNFFQAYINCKDGGMDLASINSELEEEDLTYFLKDVNKTGFPLVGFWLSGTNFPDINSKQYYWLTGGKRAIYTNWLPGEPDNQYGAENCLQWGEYAGFTGWNDYVCQTKLPYICQESQLSYL